MERQAAHLILQYRYHPAWATLLIQLQPFPIWAPCPALNEAEGRASSTSSPSSSSPLFKCEVPLPLKTCHFLISVHPSPVPALHPPLCLSWPGEWPLLHGKPPCLGTTATSRMGPSVPQPLHAAEGRRGPGTPVAGLHPAAPALSTTASVRPRALRPPH